MEDSLKRLFKSHLPGLRMKALVATGDAFRAERVLNALYLYSVCHAEDLVSHPDPRSRFLQAISGLIEAGDQWWYGIPAIQAITEA